MLVVGVLPAMALADPVQWNNNGHWYEAVLVGPPGITWEDARDAAVARGGYLVSITSASENGFAYSLVSSNDAFWFTDQTWGNGIGPWLGGYQTDHLAEPAGDWAWVSGETWSYTNWMAGGPSNGAGGPGPTEDYLQFMGRAMLKADTWNDFRDIGWIENDGSPLLPRGYIVEYDTYSVPEPASLALLGIGVAALLMRRQSHYGRTCA